MSCTHPLDATILADYWLGALATSEEEGVELHLLACDECGNRLREVIALAEGIRRIARGGSLQMIVSETFLKRAREQGLRVRQYTAPRGGQVQCTVTAEDDLLVGRLAADLRGARRVDLSLCAPDGVEQLRLSDIPFQPERADVAWQQSITYAKAAPSGALIARLVAIDESNKERVLGEYIFNHTRTMPGPAAW